MALELVKEHTRVNQMIDEELTQAIFEGDIIVPDSKPDINRILQIDGDVFISNKNIMQDKVLVDGIVKAKILYLAEDSSPAIRSMNANIGISQTFDVVGARPGMRCGIKCDIEHINYNILNSRKVNVSVVLNISCRVLNEVTLELASDIRGIQDIQVMKNLAIVNSLIGDIENTYTFKEELDIPVGKPSIKEILRSDVRISNKDMKLTDNKVLAKGEIVIATLYTADDEEQSIQFMEHEVPFNEFIDLGGVTENSSCRMDVSILDIVLQPCEDNDGELRMMHYEVILKIRVIANEQAEIQIVQDSYSPVSKIELEKKAVVLEQIVGENVGQVVVKDTLSLTDGTPEVAQVFSMACKPLLTDYAVTDERVMMEGVVNLDVLYLSTDAVQPICSFKQDIPFRHYLDIKGAKKGMACDVEADIQHYSYSMSSSSEIEVRFVLAVKAGVIQENSISIIEKAEEIPVDEKKLKSQPSITLYYVQAGDTVWKIAKRYFTTMDSILSVNAIVNPEAISVGQQLIIPRR